MLYASANRDEAVFGPDAGRFDVRRRTATPHLAFGFGEHSCLGASLARLEARVFFEELLARHPRFEPGGRADLHGLDAGERGAGRSRCVLAG